jgi:amiloride-sensitive sodium channel
MSTLWYGTLPCFDVKNLTTDSMDDPGSVIKYCEWKGIPISCSAIFSSFPTDQGICCSFNMKAADDIYQHESYSHKIIELQSKDAAESFTNTTLPEWYIGQSEPTSLPGRGKGLFLILDARLHMLSGTTLFNDYDGFTGLIHSKESFPLMSFKGFQIKPGHYNTITVQPSKIEADDSIRGLDVSDRKCMFNDDSHDLQIHSEYSYFNCIFECSLNFASAQVRDLI